MTAWDEPVRQPLSNGLDREDADDPAVGERIRALLLSQPFAVLCTQGGGQPYGSVVAYAVDQDLRTMAFATPTATRKYRLLSQCDHVAVVVDNRGMFPEDMMQVEAVTATGRAVELSPGTAFDRYAALLTDRHPQLERFIASPSTALFQIDVVRYLHVTRFQEVHQWIPQ